MLKINTKSDQKAWQNMMTKTNSQMDQFALLGTGVNLKKQQGVNLRGIGGSI